MTELNLGNNSIGDEGAIALSDSLKSNSTLTELNLESNSIGDSGARSLSDSLKSNSTLTTLDLGFYSIALSMALTRNTMKKLVVALKARNSFTFTGDLLNISGS